MAMIKEYVPITVQYGWILSQELLVGNVGNVGNGRESWNCWKSFVVPLNGCLMGRDKEIFDSDYCRFITFKTKIRFEKNIKLLLNCKFNSN